MAVLKAPHSPRSPVQTQKQMNLVRSAAGEQARALAVGRGAGEIGQHRLDLLGVRPRRFDRALRPPQLRNRDHLHSLGDLLRRFDGGDPVSEVL